MRVAVIGVAGRMGRAIVKAASGYDDIVVSGGVVREDSPNSQRDLGEIAGISKCGIQATGDIPSALADADVVIDFSLPGPTEPALEFCAAAGLPLVIGKTGLEGQHFRALDDAAGRIAIVYAVNMSVGATLMMRLAASAGRAMARECEVGVVDVHHQNKKDAPSGTALAIGREIENARGRGASTVAYESIREGDTVGEHTVTFAGHGETVQLVHRATSRMTFAHGALQAARWVVGRAPGLYGMADVIAESG